LREVPDRSLGIARDTIERIQGGKVGLEVVSHENQWTAARVWCQTVR